MTKYLSLLLFVGLVWGQLSHGYSYIINGKVTGETKDLNINLKVETIDQYFRSTGIVHEASRKIQMNISFIYDQKLYLNFTIIRSH